MIKFMTKIYQNKPLRILVIVTVALATLTVIAYLESLTAKAERNVIAGEHASLQAAINKVVGENQAILHENHDLLLQIKQMLEDQRAKEHKK